jgi:hypothetical protein
VTSKGDPRQPAGMGGRGDPVGYRVYGEDEFFMDPSLRDPDLALPATHAGLVTSRRRRRVARTLAGTLAGAAVGLFAVIAVRDVAGRLDVPEVSAPTQPSIRALGTAPALRHAPLHHRRAPRTAAGRAAVLHSHHVAAGSGAGVQPTTQVPAQEFGFEGAGA